MPCEWDCLRGAWRIRPALTTLEVSVRARSSRLSVLSIQFLALVVPTNRQQDLEQLWLAHHAARNESALHNFVLDSIDTAISVLLRERFNLPGIKLRATSLKVEVEQVVERVFVRRAAHVVYLRAADTSSP